MASSEKQTLRFVSWNVNGVENRSKPKLSFINKELTSQGAEIVFLQETHIGSHNFNALHTVDGWRCFYTVFDSQSKGVAILIKDGVQFEYICHDEDYNGGYIVLFCHLYGELFTLVNVYNHKHDTDILNRLQDYLKETAEGVLIVGGDFNTVLDLSFDRKSTTDEHKHTQLHDMFEKFTASLNLLDTWVHLHPTERAFTRSQNDSFSRLDMFLMPEDIIEQANSLEICQSSNSERESDMGNISDHKPIVLSFTLHKKDRKLNPKVGSWLEKHPSSTDNERNNVEEKKRIAAKISGEEILSVINSMTDSGQLDPHPDDMSVHSYKTYRCPITEHLKISFNHLLYCKQVPDYFKTYTNASGTRKTFNVDYLLFTKILAKRLRMLLLVYPENKSQPNTNCSIVKFSENPLKMKWTFLKNILTYLCENWKRMKKENSQPLADFRVLEALGFTENFWTLDSILPKVQGTLGEFRELKEGCPLARCILSLVLKYLEITINQTYPKTHICHYRQLVVIHNTQELPEDASFCREFSENGTELTVSLVDNV